MSHTQSRDSGIAGGERHRNNHHHLANVQVQLRRGGGGISIGLLGSLEAMFKVIRGLLGTRSTQRR